MPTPPSADPTLTSPTAVLASSPAPNSFITLPRARISRDEMPDFCETSSSPLPSSCVPPAVFAAVAWTSSVAWPTFLISAAAWSAPSTSILIVWTIASGIFHSVPELLTHLACFITDDPEQVKLAANDDLLHPDIFDLLIVGRHQQRRVAFLEALDLKQTAGKLAGGRPSRLHRNPQ